MKNKKKFLIITSLFFLNACVETTALLGPAIGVSTGNVYDASLSYGVNEIVRKETGRTTVEHMANILEPANREKKKKIDADFIKLVENNIKLTREKLFQNNN